MNNILFKYKKIKKLLTNKKTGNKILFTVQKIIKEINFMTKKTQKRNNANNP